MYSVCYVMCYVSCVMCVVSCRVSCVAFCVFWRGVRCVWLVLGRSFWFFLGLGGFWGYLGSNIYIPIWFHFCYTCPPWNTYIFPMTKVQKAEILFGCWWGRTHSTKPNATGQTSVYYTQHSNCYVLRIEAGDKYLSVMRPPTHLFNASTIWRHPIGWTVSSEREGYLVIEDITLSSPLI